MIEMVTEIAIFLHNFGIKTSLPGGLDAEKMACIILVLIMVLLLRQKVFKSKIEPLSN